ncbi:unnamed protein product, partial [Rotaria sp. Silwood2]
MSGGKESKASGKEKASDYPSWVSNYERDPGETAHQFADSVLKQQYGHGNYERGPGSEYNKIVKACDRGSIKPKPRSTCPRC